MSDLRITGMTVSCDFGDKSYGNGNGRLFSVSAKVPDGSTGTPIADSDGLMADGIEMYFTAWQTALQTRYATGEIDAQQFKQQTVQFLVRLTKIRALYTKIKGKTTEELEAFLAKAESETK
jgi:hypothetical protein